MCLSGKFPSKSKTIRIIFPNFGWFKFPTKRIVFGENPSFNGLWTSRDFQDINKVDRYTGTPKAKQNTLSRVVDSNHS